MQFICKLNKNILGKYKNQLTTEDVILTKERLENHILPHHAKDYEQLSVYLKDIIINPDYIIDDNRHKNTIIFLKEFDKISRSGRIVLKLSLGNDCIHSKNSIITLMRLNPRTWKQL